MNTRRSLPSLALALALTGSAVAQQGERLVVPLTDPSRPAELHVDLVQGCVSVSVHDSPEVIVEALAEEVSKKVERVDGMLRIPNTSIDLSVEQEDNVVVVHTEAWARTVNLRVKVPLRTSLHLSCVNGGQMEVSGVQGEHELSHVNGPIDARDVAGSMVADTTNGGVQVSLRSLSPGKSMSFSSFNGSVDVTLPAGLKADLVLDSGQGDVYTDFDVDLQPTSPTVEREGNDRRFRVTMQKEMRAKVGGGGPEMRFKTYNGGIFIRKHG